MHTLVSKGVLALFGLLAAALVAYAVPAASGSTEAAYKRSDDSADVVTTLDDDDDTDTDTGGDTSFNSGTGDSNDNTGSRETGVSRDRDLSRDDLTKDRTKDGPGTSTRDFSQNHTNDRSRNDTR